MAEGLEPRAAGVQANLRFIHGHPRLSALLCLVATVGAGALATRLSIKTDLKDLLPAHAPSVVALSDLRSRVGGAQVVEVLLHDPDGDIERFKPGLSLLAERLEALPEVLKVEYRRPKDFFERNQLLIFPTLEELRIFRREVKAEIRRRVAEEMDPFGDGGDGDGDEDEDEEDDEDEWGEPAAPAKAAKAGPAKPTGGGGEQPPGDPWERYKDARARIDEELGRLKEWYASRNGEYLALRLYPLTAATDVVQARALVDTLNREVPKALADLQEHLGGKPTGYELYGSPINTLITVESITEDVRNSSLTTILLLLTILMIAFRRLRPGPRWAGRPVAWCMGWLKAVVGRLRVLLYIFVPLLCGIVWTLGIGALTVGHLNLVTAFIFAILLGLGIDFGIHFLNRYLEQRAHGSDVLTALSECQSRTGRASMTAAATTSAGFLCLIIADFRGFSDLGVLAGVGVPLCLLALFTVFPVLILVTERWRPIQVPPIRVVAASAKGDPSERYPRPRFVVVTALLAAAISLSALPMLEFEFDFDKVRLVNEKIDAVKTRTKGTSGGRGLGSNYVLYESEAEAEEGHRLFQAMLKDKERYSSLHSYESVYSFVPLDQDERLELLADIHTSVKRKRALFDGERRDEADELIRLSKVSRLTKAELPAWLRVELSERPGPDGKPGPVGLFGRVRSKRPRGEKEEILSFAKQLGQVKLKNATRYMAGPELIKADVLKLIVNDGRRVLLLALLVVILVISLDLRSPSAVIIALSPLVVGGLWASGLMLGLEMKLDYFNVVALPAILGIGVDSGIHLVHRARESRDESVMSVMRQTGNGVFIATLTTMVGFSGLLWTDHMGLVSLAKLALLGFAACLLASFTVVPGLLQWNADRRRM